MSATRTYFLVDTGPDAMPRWCEIAFADDGAKTWVDFKSRRIPFADGSPLAHVEGSNVHVTIEGVPAEVAGLERRRAFAHLLDPWSDQGWISPEGRFYGCAFFAHDDIAHALLRKTPATLEHLGWVRVHADSFRTGTADVRITRRQQDTLARLGFVDVEPGGMRGRAFVADRDAPAPAYAVKPPLPTAPPAVRPVEPVPEPPSAALHALAERLSECGEIAHLFADAPEMIPDVGPGIWTWMIRFRDMDIGGEEDAARLAAAEGLHLQATSSDTVEVSEWPFAGVHLDAETAKMMGRNIILAPS